MKDIAEKSSLSGLVSYLRDTLDERHNNGWREMELRDSVDEIIRDTLDDNEENVPRVLDSGRFDNDAELKKCLDNSADEWFGENDFGDIPDPDEMDGFGPVIPGARA